MHRIEKKIVGTARIWHNGVIGRRKNLEEKN